MKRFLDCNASDFEKMKKEELLAAISENAKKVLETPLYHISRKVVGWFMRF